MGPKRPPAEDSDFDAGSPRKRQRATTTATRPPHAWRIFLRLMRATTRGIVRLVNDNDAMTFSFSQNGSKMSKGDSLAEARRLAADYLGVPHAAFDAATSTPAAAKDGRAALAAVYAAAFPGASFAAADIDALVGYEARQPGVPRMGFPETYALDAGALRDHLAAGGGGSLTEWVACRRAAVTRASHTLRPVAGGVPRGRVTAGRRGATQSPAAASAPHDGDAEEDAPAAPPRATAAVACGFESLCGDGGCLDDGDDNGCPGDAPPRCVTPDLGDDLGGGSLLGLDMPVSSHAAGRYTPPREPFAFEDECGDGGYGAPPRGGLSSYGSLGVDWLAVMDRGGLGLLPPSPSPLLLGGDTSLPPLAPEDLTFLDSVLNDGDGGGEVAPEGQTESPHPPAAVTAPTAPRPLATCSSVAGHASAWGGSRVEVWSALQPPWPGGVYATKGGMTALPRALAAYAEHMRSRGDQLVPAGGDDFGSEL